MDLHDLSLENIESTDFDQIAAKIETFYKDDSAQKSFLAYNWERNHLMIDGNQWLTYDGSIETGGIWRRLTPSPANEYIPRPVTNYMFDAFQTLKGYVLKNKPRSTVRPNTQTFRDKSSAKIAELILECNWERLKETYNYEYAASCLITYGTVFKKDYWDSSFLNTVKVPKTEPRPITDPQTGLPTGGVEEAPVLDPEGNPMYDVLPLGDVFTTIVEPYRMALDPMATNLHDSRWIMEYSIRPLSWIKENYDKEAPGYTGKAKEVKEEKSLSNALRRFFQLKTSSGIRGTQTNFTGLGSGGSAQMINNAAVVKEYYERPTAKYPNGRLFVVANSLVLYSSDSPCQGPDQGDWHPYSECRWEIVPGRFWGKSPMDNATEIQRQVNSIDSIIILTRKTMAVPQKLVPKGSVAPGVWTGQPGLMVEARPGPNGEMPTTIAPSGVHESVFAEREQRVQDLKNITGAVDILKGDRPPGVTAASALNMLYEVGTGKLFPVLDRWKYFTESSQKKQLRLVAKKYKEPRPEFIKMLIARNKELTEDQLKSFIGEDLYDNCNVVIEASSSIPKLKSAEQALLQENAQLGVLNLENPANRQEYLERQGIIGFDTDYSADVKRAEWENSLLDDMETSPDNKPILLVVDNHDIHIDRHSNRCKEPSFMSLPANVQKAYFAHIQEHEDAKSQAEQMQMMKSAMMGTPPPPAEPNPMQAQPKIRGGSGVDAKTKRAIQPDIFPNSAGRGQ